MPQHDQVIDNGPGLAVRTDINNAFQAIFSSSSGTIEPTTVQQGQLWFDISATGALKVRNKANTGWLDVATNVSATYLPLAGGTLTGNIAVSPASGGSTVILNKPGSGNTSSISARSNNVDRWIMQLGNATTETGANGGSDFVLARCDNAGANLDPVAGYVVFINRANGAFTYNGSDFTISPDTSSPQIVIDKPLADTSHACRIMGSKLGKSRWVMDLGDASTEPGANAGSDFKLTSYNDAGTTALFTALIIDRDTSIATFGTRVRAQGYNTKGGTGGGYNTNVFNINWSPAHLWIDNTDVGIISLTSDYRTKTDIAALPSMWQTVKTLRPVSFNWQNFGIFEPTDTSLQYGFVAHEIQQDLLSSAATAEKDAENAIQSLNLAPVVAALTKALQEAMSRIEALEVRVTQLEGAP